MCTRGPDTIIFLGGGRKVLGFTPAGNQPSSLRPLSSPQEERLAQPRRILRQRLVPPEGRGTVRDSATSHRPLDRML